MNPDRKRWLKLALLVIGFLLVCVISFWLWRPPPERTFAWVNPTQFPKAANPGPFTRVKQKVKILTAPLWQRFRRPRQQILIEATFVEVPFSAAQQAPLGPPAATNLDGTIAWTLSSSDFASVQKFLLETSEAH